MNTRWKTFKDAFITMAEVGFHNSHVVIEIEPNFTLDLKKKFVADIL